MVIHNDAEIILLQIDRYCKLNPSSIGDPENYLVDKLKKMRPENGVWTLENSLAKYVK